MLTLKGHLKSEVLKMLSGLLAAESNNPSPLKKTEKDFAAMDGQMVAWMDDWINISVGDMFYFTDHE